MQTRTLIDFLNDIAFTLERASNFSITSTEADKMAGDIYEEFLYLETKLVNGEPRFPRFGDTAFDWSITGAETLAQEFSIQYWE